jgi:hypothetical protein
MNGIYIEYNKLNKHHIEWLDKCGAKWAGIEAKFSKYNPRETHIFFIYLFNKQWVFKQGDVCSVTGETHILTADEFCKGVAERLGIEYIPKERYAFTQDEVDAILKDCDDITTVSGTLTEEYFQKKLADKLAEHARADAGFPESVVTGTKWVDTKKEVKYKHLRECFHWDEDRYILSESFDTVIRAVLKDLPQEYVVCSNESFRYGRFGKLAPHDTGNIFQRIGSISEKVEIVKEGFV